MGKIQELSEQLANQIAAGEVVERPASVVKELVENAIDAGSTQIDIYIEEAGLKMIQIIDNGEGIVNEDILNAFKRHATSKIHTRDDLFRIRSLGFRGEALPSIASVSELTLETASETETKGSFVRLKGGIVEEHGPAALRKGTKITVANLFFNTPARLKYVKTIQTELANIGDIVNRLALSHPTIAFRLVHDGNKMLSTTGKGDLKQTIAGIYGISTAKKMIQIKNQDLDFQVTGYVSLPELTRASRNYISLIINGRYVKNFLLNKAIVEGYGSKLMVGRFPIAVIDITMDPLLVDVNVHPTKQEVRLSKEKELMTLISTAIHQALSQEQLIPSATDNAHFKKKFTPQSPSEQLTIPLPEQKNKHASHPLRHQGNLAYDKASGQFFMKEPEKSESLKPNDAVFDQTDQKETVVFEKSPHHQSNIAYSEVVETVAENKSDRIEEVSEPALTTEAMTGSTTNAQFPELEYFGQMHGTYLFAQSQEGLYIIDQHAAQERIKYEYFREKISHVGEDLQELLVPIVLDYPNNDVLKLNEKTDLLAQVGIHLEEFGHNSFVVRSHPTWYPDGKEEVIIREMIDILLDTGKISVKKFREDTAIMMSCKGSIKANHYLNDAQARQLLQDLARCENPFNCPHGRPVLIHFTNTDMEKMFKRIQDSH